MIESDLEAPSIQVRKTIDAAGEVDPCRHRRGRESPVARLRAEEEDLLACWADTVTEHRWEQFGQPRAAGEHVGAGRDAGAVARDEGVDGPVAVWWTHRRHAVVDALLDRLTHDRLHGASGHDGTRLRLQHPAGDRAEVELRIPLFERGPVERLVRRAEPSQCLNGLVGGRVIGTGHPQDPGSGEELLTGIPKQIQPGIKRALRPSGVDLLAAIADAEDARGATGARAGVAGAERVNQDDRPSASAELQGRPGAECAGADHHDIGSARHHTLGRRRQSRRARARLAGAEWGLGGPRAALAGVWGAAPSTCYSSIDGRAPHGGLPGCGAPAYPSGRERHDGRKSGNEGPDGPPNTPSDARSPPLCAIPLKVSGLFMTSRLSYAR